MNRRTDTSSPKADRKPSPRTLAIQQNKILKHETVHKTFMVNVVFMDFKQCDFYVALLQNGYWKS